MLDTFLALAAASPLALVPPTGALQDPVEADAPVTPMEQYEAIQAEYDDAMQTFWKDYREVSEEEQEAFLAKRPEAGAFIPRFLELAKAHPKTEAAASSYLWVARYSEDKEVSSAALDGLIGDHVDSPSMGQACNMLMRDYAVGESYLERILEESSDPSVQGSACYNLGKHYLSLSDMHGTLSGGTDELRSNYEGYLGGADVVARILAMDPEKLQSQGIAYLERVCSDYAEVEYYRGTIGEAAERDLYELRNLQLGMLAPEVTGEDIFGAEFSLSDYRGKVVVIDFWGHW